MKEADEESVKTVVKRRETFWELRVKNYDDEN